MERTILHCDMNNFYASVECLYNPSIRGQPVAVAGDPEQRHGIILAKNNEAKQYGVRTGDPLWMARKKCPDIVFVPPHYKKYLFYSKLAHEIYLDYTEQVEPFGLDECWLDVSGSGKNGVSLADEIRGRIRTELGVTASIGVSYNKIFAKLGSDLKKPDATTEITRDNFMEKAWPLPVGDLLYVGPATQKTLHRYCINTIGDLARANVSFLRYKFGITGEMLWRFARGEDTLPVASHDAEPKIKSVGNSTTAPRDLISDNDVRITMLALCESVSERLRDYEYGCRTVQITIRANDMLSYERQKSLPYPVNTTQDIFREAFALYKQHHDGKPIRSIGVKACSLVTPEMTQLSLFPDAQKRQKQELLEEAIDGIRDRFGHFSIQRGIMLTDPKLSALDAKGEHIIYPVSLFR